MPRMTSRLLPTITFTVMCRKFDRSLRPFQSYPTKAEAESVAMMLRKAGCETVVQVQVTTA
jgi:hypothetical protein